MNKIKTKHLISLLIALSMLCYSIRGKIGAIIITLLNLIFLVYMIKEIKIKKSFSNFYALFIFAFSLLFGIIRSVNFEYYLFIGYLTAIFLLLNNKLDIYDNLWSILGKISLFEAIGIYMQKLLPNVYYSIISTVFPSSVVLSIKSRLAEGYYTGFTREISFTMFFIVIGLGIYIYDLLMKDKSSDESSYKIQKFIKVAILFGALFISGKRATLIIFVITLLVVQFIKSKDTLKILKYAAICFGIFFAIYASFPIWSKVESLSRIVELLDFINEKNVIGITNGRTVIYQNAIDLWQKSKIFGIGWGNFKYMVAQSLWYSGFDVHNCYLQILCENGIIGAIIFYLLTIISIFRFIKCIKKAGQQGEKSIYRLALITAYIQIFFIIYSFTEPILYEYTDYIIYFVSINITNILLYNLAKNKKEKNTA